MKNPTGYQAISMSLPCSFQLHKTPCQWSPNKSFDY